jgi:3-oxoacyl-[acyl-carrier-protein] synthase III
VLVIGAETFSRILDWQDRGTCVLFGDGAGAVVLRAETGQGTAADHGLLSTHLRSDGTHYSRLQVDGGPGSDGRVGYVRMDGKEVFRHAVTNMADIAMAALSANGVEVGAVDWVVPHQANVRILEATAKRLDIPTAKVVSTVDRHANTSAASVPLALDQAVSDGRIKPGHLVLMVAMGGGFTWGAALARW